MNDRRAEDRTEPAANTAAQAPAPADAADKNAASRKRADRDRDDDEPWRHAPVAPRDESPAKSLGRAVSEVVTGPLEVDTAKDRTKP